MMQTALIVGGSNRSVTDVKDCLKIFKPDVTIYTNDSGANHSGKVQHWASLHIEKMPEWIEHRRSLGFSDPEVIWTNMTSDIPPELDGFDVRRSHQWGGSSVLLGVSAALQMGCVKIVVAGAPLENEVDVTGHPGAVGGYAQYRSAWTKRDDILKDVVRSVSGGWTESYYGRPTKTWLNVKAEESDG